MTGAVCRKLNEIAIMSNNVTTIYNIGFDKNILIFKFKFIV